MMNHFARMSQIEWYASLNPIEYKIQNKSMRKTSIIPTIGPKTNNVETLHQLRNAGVNIIRLNASHGDHGYFKSCLLYTSDAADE